MTYIELQSSGEMSSTILLPETHRKTVFVVGGSPLEQQALRSIFSDMGYVPRSLNHLELVHTAPIEPSALVLARLDSIEKWEEARENFLQACLDNPVVLMVPKGMAIEELRGLTTNVRAIVYTGLSNKSLVSILQLVADGMSVLPQPALETIAAPSIAISLETSETDRLTVREQEIASKVAEGLTSKEIGRALDISVNTVNAHLNAVMRKLNLTKRTQVAVWWLRETTKFTLPKRHCECLNESAAP